MLKRNHLLHATLAAAIVVVAGCASVRRHLLRRRRRRCAGHRPRAVCTSREAPSWWPGSGPRLASRDPALEQWKRQAAERIHTANAKQLFEGRPHHLLQGSSSSM